MDTSEANRRPIKARGNPFIQRLARRMAEAGITPNSISVASVVFAALGAVCLLVSPVGWGAIACAVGIQLRLLCNLIDGMVAVEGGVFDLAEFHVNPADELVFFVHCGNGVFAVGQVFGVEFDGAGGVELRPGDTDWFLGGVSRVDV